MYLEFFGLREFPFSLAPDPRFLYLSVQHREALAHLLYGVRSEGGFVQLTGEIGTGKTTVCRCFLEQLPAETKAAVILNPRLGAAELLAAVCDEFEIPQGEGPETAKAHLDRLNRFLLEEHAQGHRAVLVVDEAQNLDPGVLEQLRLLTNLETSRHKLLQIILMGQPELRETLAGPGLTQLAQRITARFHLGPLSREETAAYVRHRLEVAGSADPLFPDDVLRLLRRLSGGVPRMINILCDRALLGAFVQGKRQVDTATLRQAAREVSGEGTRARFLRPEKASLVAAGVTLALGALLVGGYRSLSRPGNPPLAAVQPAAPAPASATIPAPPPIAAPPPAAPAPPPVPAKHQDPPRPAKLARVAPPQAAVARPGDALQTLLAQPEAATGKEAAHSALLALWGIDYTPGKGPVCAQAQAHGLACLRGQGGLDLLRRFNRPAVLLLFDEQGRERSLVLRSAAEDGLVTLLAGKTSATLDLRWYGAYLLLWRAPPGTAGVIAPGATGAAVAWLAGALGKAPSGEEKPAYDESMTEQVREFQHAVGIPEDGVAGPQTLLLLDKAPGPGTPTLRSAR